MLSGPGGRVKGSEKTKGGVGGGGKNKGILKCLKSLKGPTDTNKNNRGRPTLIGKHTDS